MRQSEEQRINNFLIISEGKATHASRIHFICGGDFKLSASVPLLIPSVANL